MHLPPVPPPEGKFAGGPTMLSVALTSKLAGVKLAARETRLLEAVEAPGASQDGKKAGS